MKVTGFKVDKTQPAGTMKVGNGWQFAVDRQYNNVKMESFTWVHDEGVPSIASASTAIPFEVVQIADTNELKMAFFATKDFKDEVEGTFEVEVTGGDGTAVLTTPPTFTADTLLGTVGLITITPDTDGGDTYFTISYTPKGGEKTVWYEVRQFAARDWMGAPMANGPYNRNAGQWKKV